MVIRIMAELICFWKISPTSNSITYHTTISLAGYSEPEHNRILTFSTIIASLAYKYAAGL